MIDTGLSRGQESIYYLNVQPLGYCDRGGLRSTVLVDVSPERLNQQAEPERRRERSIPEIATQIGATIGSQSNSDSGPADPTANC